MKKKILILVSLFAIIILFEILILHWEPELIFFSSWLLFSLIIQHDSRLSSIAGLIILSLCPVMVLLDWPEMGEKLAGYSFAFLAIGVIVLLEDMVLNSNKFFPRKIDIEVSFIPASSIKKSYSLGKNRYDWNYLFFLFFQVFGALALVLFFLNSVTKIFSVQSFFIVLIAICLSLLIIFFLFWVGKKYGTIFSLRLSLIVLLFPAIAFLRHFVIGAQAQALEHVINNISLIDMLNQAEISQAVPEEGISRQMWNLDSKSQRVLFQHPGTQGDSQIRYTLRIPNHSYMKFDLSLSPDCWNLPGDGVTFSVYIVTDERTTNLLFSTYVDPKKNPEDRHWKSFSIDLKEYSGKTVKIILETRPGPEGDIRYDWAGWAEPEIVSYQ
jgi:hypothetical protein